jgi:hypothetical protein
MIQIAAFWKKQSKNNRVYYTGKMGNGRLLLFQNQNKKAENHPDLLLYVAQDNSSVQKEDQERQQTQPEQEDDIPF